MPLRLNFTAWGVPAWADKRQRNEIAAEAQVWGQAGKRASLCRAPGGSGPRQGSKPDGRMYIAAAGRRGVGRGAASPRQRGASDGRRPGGWAVGAILVPVESTQKGGRMWLPADRVGKARAILTPLPRSSRELGEVATPKKKVAESRKFVTTKNQQSCMKNLLKILGEFVRRYLFPESKKAPPPSK